MAVNARPLSRTRVLLTACLALLVSSTAALADDWPQWLGPQRDGVWRETGILEKFPASGPVIRWRVPIEGGYTGPAVAEGRVYVMDRVLAKGTKNPANQFQRVAKGIPGTERVLCFNEHDGNLLWKQEYDCPYTASYPLGPRTTPLIHDKKVYTLGTEGHLFCLDTEKGKVQWSHVLTKDLGAPVPFWGFSSHLLIDGKKLISMAGGKGSAVVAFDKDTGEVLWRALTTDAIGYCAPMIYEMGGKRQLIVWHGKAINGLDPETGKVYWTYPLVVYSDMAISVPRIVDDQVYLTATFNLSALLKPDAAASTAKMVWKSDGKNKLGFDSVFAAPFIENGYIYGTASDGDLRCVEAATGKRIWSGFEPNRGKKARSSDSFLIKNGDRFFLFTEQGDLIIAKLSPKGYEEISRAHLLEPTFATFGRSMVWSHPAFANKSVYARNDKELICVSLAAETGGR